MQYTPHYNLNLPEGTDIVNPLIQDNPNYSAIDTALYDNKLRVVGTATHTKTGTNHSIVLADSDIPVFRFVATGDYAVGDTFSVDGVTVTPRLANGSSLPTGAFKINSTVEAVLDGTVLNLINVDGTKSAAEITYSNTSSGLSATDVQDAIDEVNNKIPHVGGVTATKGSKIGAFWYVASKYANILKVSGYFECAASLTSGDTICSFAGISNTRRAYSIAGKSDASKFINISIQQGSLSIIVDATPAQPANLGDIYTFDMVIICD